MQDYVLLYQKLILLRVGSIRLYLSSMSEELLPGVPFVNESRWAKVLARLRNLLSTEDSGPQGEEVKMLEHTVVPGTETLVTSPSVTSMLAAPVEAQPAPVSVVTMPKAVNAKRKPLEPALPPGTDGRDTMNTRVASYEGVDPFYKFLRVKFAGIYDTGQPDLPEVAALGLAGLGGVYLGGRAASYGASPSAKSRLDPWLGGIDTFTGDSALRGIAEENLREAASANKLKYNGTSYAFRSAGKDQAILDAAAAMEKQLAHNITKARVLPLKLLGGGAGVLGAGYLINEYAKHKAQLAAAAQQGY